MDTNEKLVSVYTASTPGRADIARLALEEAGIRAAITNDSLQGVFGFATVGAHALPNVFVAEHDVEAALEVLATLTPDDGFMTFDLKSMRGQEGGETAPESHAIDAWPLCPQCQKARVTVCPICSTSGTNFPRAYENFDQDEVTQVLQVENAEGAAPPPEQRLALICTTCDEPWLARFLRRCEWCGHDFGVGLKVDYVPPVREAAEPVNPRAVLLVFVMAAALTAIFAWFWFVGK